MPTSVSIVRQCLAIEAVHALDEAVRVARRRGHAQTTSLHLVSSLLSLPSSPLREACSRIRNDAFTMRIQFKALELCLSVSLDRLPSALSGVGEQEQELEPPVSNSLMAAVKRSQANQRRQPENFSFYQQHMMSSSSSSSAVTVVKVELRNLILSILDDPVVSRVFGDAGFRSCEIKMAILRQVHQLFRYSRNKWPRGPPPPPLFLCNLNGDNNHLRRKGFSFPFIGFSEFPDSEENCRRIAEVMEKNDGNGRRNPLLVGACAFDSLKSFLGMIQGRRERSEKLSGLSVISLQDDILRFVTGKYEECLMKLKFEEVGKIVGNSVAHGVVINFGDLKALVCDHASIDTLRFIVSELTKLLEIHGSKVWLIGAAATYEAYLKFSQMFPSAEMDLDLQLLPITATRISMAKSYPKSSSFRRQFRCHLCEEKCQQEVNTLSDARVGDSIAASVPPLPHVAERNTDGGFHEALASKDRDIFTAKISGLHKKWDNICQHLHYGQQFPKPSAFRFSPGVENVNQESDSSFQENSPLSNKRFMTISISR